MPAWPTVFLYFLLHTWHTVEAHILWFSDLNCSHCQTQHVSNQRYIETPSPFISHNAPHLRHISLYQCLKALIDALPWLCKVSKKQSQMRQIGCVCPRDLVLSLGQWRGPVWACVPTPPTPCQIHTTWERCRSPFHLPCGGIRRSR